MHQAVRQFHEKNGYQLDKPASQELDRELVAISEGLAKLAKDMESRGLYLQEQGDPRQYRVHLLLEEVSELVQALACGDEEEIADGGADVLFVTVGTLESFGIPTDYVFDEVARSNLTKRPRVGMDRVRDKGPSYVPPNFYEAIRRGREMRSWKTNERV